MQVNYKWVIDRIISKYEGKYSNDRGDAGGPTMYGITYIDLAEYLKISKASTYNMMPHMSLATAEAIYSTKYERGSRFDDLQSGIDMCVMDYDINSGLARGAHSLQAILGIRQSGIVDDATVFAANKMDADKLIDAICDERLDFMHRIKGGASWSRFGKGWGARVQDLRVTSKHLAANKSLAEAPQMQDQQDPNGMGKATHKDPKTKSSVIKTAGGAATGAGATAHLTTHSPLVTIGIAGAVIAVGGFAYYELVKSQNNAQKLVVLPPSAAAVTPKVIAA